MTGCIVAGLNHAMHKMGEDPKKVRDKIVKNAKKLENSKKYNQDVEKDNFKSGTNKCNKFVYDILE